MPELSRRSFLAAGFPFFRRRGTVTLGGVRFRVLRHGHGSRRYLRIHGNEETAREVLEAHMRTHAGVAYVAAGHERNVPVPGGQLDPNRMFSREGAEKSLRNLNPGWSDAQVGRALDWLDRRREKLIRALLPPPGEVLFALHNNSQGYSVKDEIPISDRTSIRKPDEPHEFFLCTDPKDFAALAESPYNIVLQQFGPKEDDGSLSRLAARRGVRYVNLEVALGKTAVQQEMLEWAERHLKQAGAVRTT